MADNNRFSDTTLEAPHDTETSGFAPGSKKSSFSRSNTATSFHDDRQNSTRPKDEEANLGLQDKAMIDTDMDEGREGGWVRKVTRRTRDFLMEDVDPDYCTIPMAVYCFLTGWTDAVSFTAAYIWCAYQTGNTIQLGLAIARLFSGPFPRDYTFHMADRQALTSLLAFLIGSFLGRIGDKIGAKTRIWLVLSTLLQAGFTLAGCLTLLVSGEGSFATDRGDTPWTSVLGFTTLAFISASVGLQSITGKRLNTQFATTVVLTTIWTELVCDPGLFYFWRLIKTRDHKMVAILMVFLGGMLGRALIDEIGGPGTLGIAAGIRLFCSFGWFFVRAKGVTKGVGGGEKKQVKE